MCLRIRAPQVAIGQEFPRIKQGITSSGGSSRALRDVMTKPSIARGVKKVKETQRKIKKVKARNGDLKRTIEIE